MIFIYYIMVNIYTFDNKVVKKILNLNKVDKKQTEKFNEFFINLCSTYQTDITDWGKVVDFVKTFENGFNTLKEQYFLYIKE